MHPVTDGFRLQFRSLLAAWLPALMPSWRFFDRIGPALRIEFALTDTRDVTAAVWQPLRPRPTTVAVGTMVWRLFWNPEWNETLYLTSCAERLLDDPSAQRADALWTRAAAAVHSALASLGDVHGRLLHVRIVETMRQDEALVNRVVFVSAARPLVSDGGADGR